MARLVYSSGPDGAGCPSCGARPCRCGTADSRGRRGGGAVRVRRERSGRRGKTVTVAAPFELARAEAAELLTRLKKRCGSGGTLKSAAGESVFSIEIQGDHVETVLAALSAAGYAARRAGG